MKVWDLRQVVVAVAAEMGKKKLGFRSEHTGGELAMAEKERNRERKERRMSKGLEASMENRR